MSVLSDFAEVIQKQGEESRQRQNELVKQMRNALPGAIEELKHRSDDWLLDALVEFSSGAYDPRETAIKHEFRDAVKAELKLRLSANKHE